MGATTDETVLNELITDLTGQPLPLPDNSIPPAAVKLLNGRGKGIGHSQFNELLLLLGYDRITHEFFQYLVDGTVEYKSSGGINSFAAFRAGVDRFRKTALLHFGNVKYAFKLLSRDIDELQSRVGLFSELTAKSYRERHKQVLPPEPIAGSDTFYLGYIIEKELRDKLEQNPNDVVLQREESKRKVLVEKGIKNNEAYLVSDHMDVYIATSMRERHEYQMVYQTTRAIFENAHLSKLNLRYFDPTQAYCHDRIDKGLTEALMLKRAKCTVYFAQESDTLGKDSELASTLAQGKAVIAYVPAPPKNAADKLIQSLVPRGRASQIRDVILRQLRIYEPDAAWTDGEVRRWIGGATSFNKRRGIARLQKAMQKHWKKRDDTLRNLHPLGIQVNLSTGVANGVLVVNTVAQCARLIRAIVLRELEFDLDAKQLHGKNYLYLRERISKCIFRVVTGDMLLTNAFWNFYLDA